MNKRVEIIGVKQTRVIEAEIPKAPPKGMVIKIHYAGVCHTDINTWTNEFLLGDEKLPVTALLPLFTYPRVPGHEIAGEVYELGDGECPNDPHFTIGDKVVVYALPGCGTCNRCIKKKEQLCDQRMANIIGGGSDGGYQAYLPIEARDLAQRVPDSIPMEVACLLPCSGITSYNAVCTARQTINESHHLEGAARVLIVGVGSLGLWNLQWAKALYPENTRVVVADLTVEKLEVAKKLGADGGILLERGLSAAETKKRITEEVCGGEFDVVFDNVGLGSLANILQQCLRRGGSLILVGLAGGTLPLDPVSFLTASKTIYGIGHGSTTQLTEILDLVAKQKVSSPPITVYQPEQAQTVLEKLHDGVLNGKAVLKFT